MIMNSVLTKRFTMRLPLLKMNNSLMHFSALLCFLFVFSLRVSAQITSIEVTSPSQNDIWTYGQSFYIGWTVTGSGNVKIEYSINGGLNWSLINSSVASTNGANTYLWSISNEPTTQALIRISETDGTPIDTSKAYFMIKSPQASLSGKVKILPFGDSITFGFMGSPPPPNSGDLVGYQYRLWDSLRTNDYNFDFIGSEYSGYNYFPDYQNGGFGGILIVQLAQLLIDGTNVKYGDIVTPGPYLNYHPADVILLHTGTNDVPNVDSTALGALLQYHKKSKYGYLGNCC